MQSPRSKKYGKITQLYNTNSTTKLQFFAVNCRKKVQRICNTGNQESEL